MMDADNDTDDLDTSAKFKSPTREKLFRACKSPLKPTTKSTTPKGKSPSTRIPGAKYSTPRKTTEVKKQKEHIPQKGSVQKGLEITAIIEKFPEIHKNFEITKKAGEGTFSKVYLAKLRCDPSQIFALKHLIPTSSPERIENELKCLQILGGMNNILPVKSVLRNGDQIIFILPYVPHAKFTDYMQCMTVEDIRNYMFHLLTSLKHVHHLGIIHRDIKPSNFLYSHQLDRYCLIDFGLAMPVPGSKNKILNDYTASNNNTAMRNSGKAQSGNRSKVTSVNNCRHPANSICDICKGRARQSAPRAGTPGFRSPEVLLRHPHQTTAVDMWSTGVILLSILSRRYPFFKAKDDMEALTQIITVFGSAKMKKMADSIDKDLICVPPIVSLDTLQSLCEKLAQRKCLLKNDKPNPSTAKTLESSNKRKWEKCTDAEVAVESLPKRTDAGKADCVDEDDTCPVTKEPEKLCQNSKCSCNNCADIPASVYNLLERLLELDPYKRISASEALEHTFIKNK